MQLSYSRVMLLTFSVKIFLMIFLLKQDLINSNMIEHNFFFLRFDTQMSTK